MSVNRGERLRLILSMQSGKCGSWCLAGRRRSTPEAQPLHGNLRLLCLYSVELHSRHGTTPCGTGAARCGTSGALTTQRAPRRVFDYEPANTRRLPNPVAALVGRLVELSKSATVELSVLRKMVTALAVIWLCRFVPSAGTGLARALPCEQGHSLVRRLQRVSTRESERTVIERA